jgi:hypothetical protein
METQWGSEGLQACLETEPYFPFESPPLPPFCVQTAPLAALFLSINLAAPPTLLFFFQAAIPSSLQLPLLLPFYLVTFGPFSSS